MGAPIVFFDIAGPDLQQQSHFYRSVFEWEIGDDGRFSVSSAPTLSAALRQDPSDKVIYLGVADISATLAAVVANGGTIVAPRFEVPGVVVLGLFIDPAGNSMGLVELDGAKPKVP